MNSIFCYIINCKKSRNAFAAISNSRFYDCTVIPWSYQQTTPFQRRPKSSRSDNVVVHTNNDVTHTIAVNTSDSTSQMKIKVLFFSQVCIEPTYSAAGVRSLFLLHKLRYDTPNVTSVHIITPPNHINSQSTKTDRNTKQSTVERSTEVPTDLASPNTNDFQYHTLLPNRSADADRLLDQLYQYNNGEHIDAITLFIIIFDRYYSEEMYSFHVYNYFRTKDQLHYATFILDMQDMHSLRLCRQIWVKERQKQIITKHRNHKKDNAATNCIEVTDDVLQHTIPPDDIIPTITDDKLLRELASIYRCDLTFVCSSYEYTLLINKYHIQQSKLCIAPLFGTNEDIMIEHNNLCYQKRHDYIFVGGMKHEPNVDAIRQLKRLWPLIRQKFIKNESSSNNNASMEEPQQKQLPNLYIYGAFCSSHFRDEIHQPSVGLYKEGYYASSIYDVLRTKRVLLSPLRFGAGIKGKHIDAWHCYLPIVTTSIGSEGMVDNPTTKTAATAAATDGLLKFGGLIANTDSNFVDAAYKLYQNENVWNEAVANMSIQQMQELCNDWDRIRSHVMDVVHSKSDKKHQSNAEQMDKIVQHILWHQTNRSTEYFSKYIEIKERSTRTPPIPNE